MHNANTPHIIRKHSKDRAIRDGLSVSLLAALDLGGVAMAESGEHGTLALAGVAFVSRGTLGNVQIVDPAGRDVVDKAW